MRPLEFAVVMPMVVALSSGGAQQLVRVPDRITCLVCRIEVIPKGDLEEAAEAGDLTSEVRSAVTLADGGFLIAQFSPKMGLPLRFDAGGRYRGPVSRSGSGPLEFRHASHLSAYRGDSVLVMDEMLLRVSVLSPLGQVVRSVRQPELARSRDAVAFPDGQVLATKEGLTRQASGDPLQLYSAELVPLRGFGGAKHATAPGAWTGFTRRVAVAPDGSIWAVPVGNYVLEQWSRDGRLLRSLQRDAPWFGPRWAGIPDDPRSPAPAFVQGMRIDSLGLLWVFSSVPDAHWRNAYGAPVTMPMRNGRGGTSYPIERMDKYGDTMIEVIDVERAVVIARRRIDEVVSALFGGDRAVATGSGEDSQRTVVLAFRLRGLVKRAN